MKAFTDFFPLIIFFAAYTYTKDIISATSALIVASVIQVSYLWLKYKKVEKMHLITLVLVVLFGGMTVLFQDATFIKWKPTVINWLFAAVFLGSEFIGKQNIIQKMLASNMTLPENIWKNLNRAWAAFFAASGAGNIYVAYHYSEEIWVNFKVFGLLALTIIFVILQGIYISRYLDDNKRN